MSLKTVSGYTTCVEVNLQLVENTENNGKTKHKAQPALSGLTCTEHLQSTFASKWHHSATHIAGIQSPWWILFGNWLLGCHLRHFRNILELFSHEISHAIEKSLA